VEQFFGAPRADREGARSASDLPGPGGSQPSSWDAAADTYDAERAHDRIYHACIRAAHQAIDRARPVRILDVGCGTGLATQPLCRSGRTVIGSDYSLRSLQNATRKGLHFITAADVRALPFPDACVDAVLCANALQHLTPEDQPRAIAELRRVVRPGGTLVVTVHHYSRWKRRHGWIKEGTPGHPGIDYIFRFSPADLQRLLPQARIGAIGVALRLERWIPGWSRRLLARLGYGHMLIAVERGGTPR
jgi:SAM-dependent methyltransferase